MRFCKSTIIILIACNYFNGCCNCKNADALAKFRRLNPSGFKNIIYISNAKIEIFKSMKLDEHLWAQSVMQNFEQHLPNDEKVIAYAHLLQGREVRRGMPAFEANFNALESLHAHGAKIYLYQKKYEYYIECGLLAEKGGKIMKKVTLTTIYPSPSSPVTTRESPKTQK